MIVDLRSGAFNEHLTPATSSDGLMTSTRFPVADWSSGRDDLALWILRLGLAFVFTYAATAMFLNPASFMMYVPGVLVSSVGATPILVSVAAFELLLAIGLLWTRFTSRASLMAAGMMVVIVLCNLDAFHVLFRNVAIGCAALSLALQTRKNRPKLLD